MSVSYGLLDELLSAPENSGTELHWMLTYRLESDAPGVQRCYSLHALPRQREPEGIDWKRLGESDACDPSTAPKTAPK